MSGQTRKKRKGSTKSSTTKTPNINRFALQDNEPSAEELSASCVICTQMFGSIIQMIQFERCRNWTCQRYLMMSTLYQYVGKATKCVCINNDKCKVPAIMFSYCNRCPNRTEMLHIPRQIQPPACKC